MRHFHEHFEEWLQSQRSGKGSSELRGSDAEVDYHLGLFFLETEEAAELYVDEVLDGQGRFLYLDSKSSVSALPEAGTGLRP